MKRVAWMLLGLLFLNGTAFADDSGEMMEMLKDMQRQMARMQSTIDTQNAKIQQLESRSTAGVSSTDSTPAPSPVMSDADFQKSLKDNIGEAIPWMKGAKYGGDFRLRYEAFAFDDNDTDENVASDRTRNRFRIRLRWGFEKNYGDDWKVGFRLATGGTTDNTSTNATLGNPGYFTFKTVVIDRAYATYSPNGLKDYGPIKGATIGAGKFDNPFLRYSTAIVWDGDVTPEGLYEKATLQLLSSEDNKLNLYGTLGQFLVNENSGVDTDAEIFAYQGALHWSTYNFGTETPVDFTAAASLYNYHNWFNTVANNTAATSYLRTNTRPAVSFEVLDIYPEVSFKWNSKPVTLWANFVENIANEGTDNPVMTGGSTEFDIHDQNFAWGLGLKVGKAKKKGDLEAFYGYYEIGANAVVAAFNDSDFGGPGTVGHTNRQGHKFGFGYMLTDSITVNWTGYVVSPLNPQPATIVANSINETVFRSQADLVYKF